VPVSRQPVTRPSLQLYPVSVVSVLALLCGIGLLVLTVPMVRQDGWAGLIWALPGVVFVIQPFFSIVRGQDETLRIGTHTVGLTGLRKVTVYTRRSWGTPYAIAVLKLGNRVEEFSGRFMSSRGFTRLVLWLAVPVETLDGYWTPQRVAAERPDLRPSGSR